MKVNETAQQEVFDFLAASVDTQFLFRPDLERLPFAVEIFQICEEALGEQKRRIALAKTAQWKASVLGRWADETGEDFTELTPQSQEVIYQQQLEDELRILACDTLKRLKQIIDRLPAMRAAPTRGEQGGARTEDVNLPLAGDL